MGHRDVEFFMGHRRDRERGMHQHWFCELPVSKFRPGAQVSCSHEGRRIRGHILSSTDVYDGHYESYNGNLIPARRGFSVAIWDATAMEDLGFDMNGSLPYVQMDSENFRVLSPLDLLAEVAE